MSKTQFSAAAAPSDMTIDCLMVALPVPERLEFAKQSIADFCRQSYPCKRLIIVMNGGQKAIKDVLTDHVATLDRPDIQLLNISGDLRLGELRNISIAAATADLICQWDDDDRYHPDRLSVQAEYLRSGNYEAVFMQDVLQYFSNAKKLYWTNWRATPAAGHTGTIMAKRSTTIRYPEAGDVARLGEDMVVAQTLIAGGRVGYLAGRAELYLYISHGANSWNDEHHSMLSSELAISQALLRRREAQMNEAKKVYNLKSPITIMGNNGPAYII